MGGLIGAAVIIFFFWMAACLNVLREYERAVTFRLGRLLEVEQRTGTYLDFLAD